jgi:bacteriocin-like protein
MKEKSKKEPLRELSKSEMKAINGGEERTRVIIIVDGKMVVVWL